MQKCYGSTRSWTIELIIVEAHEEWHAFSFCWPSRTHCWRVCRRARARVSRICQNGSNVHNWCLVMHPCVSLHDHGWFKQCSVAWLSFFSAPSYHTDRLFVKWKHFSIVLSKLDYINSIFPQHLSKPENVRSNINDLFSDAGNHGSMSPIPCAAEPTSALDHFMPPLIRAGRQLAPSDHAPAAKENMVVYSTPDPRCPVSGNRIWIPSHCRCSVLGYVIPTSITM